MSAIVARVLRVLVQRAPFERLVHAPTAFALLAVLGVGLAGNIMLGDRTSYAGTSDDVIEAGEQEGNVLFLVVDTLRADHLPMYGYENGSTPNLDRLAEDAIRFDQAFANSSWTRPSFASILTGRLPSSHGVMAKSDALPDTVTTLPEALETAGYTTAGYATNFNVAPYFNFHQGFDEYSYLEPEFVLGADDASAKLLLMQFIRQRIEKMRAMQGEVLPGTAYQDAETVNGALTSWIDRQPASPWFLFVGYMDPHDPYFSHPYDGSGYARAAHQHPDPSEAPALTALYDGEISYWDAELGKLLDVLRERGLYDDLTIIVTSDHGEEFNDHGGFWHGTTLYDEQVRVPLLVKLPQSRRGGTVVRHWVQSIDLMPTVLKLFEAPVPEGVQGGDLFTGTDVVYAEESHEGNVLESVRELDGTDEYKLITANRDNPRGLTPLELYRVDLDPAEQENLAPTSPDAVRMATKSLLEQRALAKEDAVAADSVELDEDVAAHLEAIGYIER
jgi:arylsulfatase A-like enzyme